MGRATLYRRPELHAIVAEHRRHGKEALTLTGLAVQVDQLRQGLEAVAAKVRHHEELLRTLRRSGPSGPTEIFLFHRRGRSLRNY